MDQVFKSESSFFSILSIMAKRRIRQTAPINLNLIDQPKLRNTLFVTYPDLLRPSYAALRVNVGNVDGDVAFVAAQTTTNSHS